MADEQDYCWIAKLSTAPEYFVPRDTVEFSDNIASWTKRPEPYEMKRYCNLGMFGIGNSGTRIDFDTFKFVQLATDPDKKLQPLMPVCGTAWLTNNTVRMIVEKVEPDIHQFLPVNVLHANGSPSIEAYYFFNICQNIASVDFKKSNLHWRMHQDGSQYASSPYHDDELVVVRAAIFGKHVWRDSYFAQSVFFSNRMKVTMQTEGFKIFEFMRVRIDTVKQVSNTNSKS